MRVAVQLAWLLCAAAANLHALPGHTPALNKRGRAQKASLCATSVLVLTPACAHANKHTYKCSLCCANTLCSPVTAWLASSTSITEWKERCVCRAGHRNAYRACTAPCVLRSSSNSSSSTRVINGAAWEHLLLPIADKGWTPQRSRSDGEQQTGAAQQVSCGLGQEQ